MELSLINVLMIFGIKEKKIILTNTINLLGLARFVDFIRLIDFYFGCADLNLAGICWVSCRKFSDAVMAIFSGQSVISRVYTSRLGNGTDRMEPRPRWY